MCAFGKYYSHLRHIMSRLQKRFFLIDSSTVIIVNSDESRKIHNFYNFLKIY